MTGHRRIDLAMATYLALSFGGMSGVAWARGEMTGVLAAWVVFSLALGLYLWLIPRPLRRAYGRVLLVFVPLLIFAALFVVSLLSVLGVQAKEASVGLVGGSLVALGWIATYLVTSFREAEARSQARRDTLLACRSEIFALIEKLDNQDIKANAAAVQARILEGDGIDAEGKPVEYFPFSTRESAPLVFEAIGAQVPTLENEPVVEAIIRFYAEYTDLRQLIEDTRAEAVAGLSRQRRAGLHGELTRRRVTTLTWGLRAVCEINGNLGVERPDNIPRSGKNPEVNP